MKINDVILLVIYITITIAMTWYVVSDKMGATADQIQVYSDGEIVKSIPLPAEDQSFMIENDLGKIKIEIKSNQVSVVESDCPDQICVHTKAINQGGEMIVCLPNKMYVEIKKKENNNSEADVISQ